MEMSARINLNPESDDFGRIVPETSTEYYIADFRVCGCDHHPSQPVIIGGPYRTLTAAAREFPQAFTADDGQPKRFQLLEKR